MKKGHIQMKTIELAFNEDIFVIYSFAKFGAKLAIFYTKGAFGVTKSTKVDF